MAHPDPDPSGEESGFPHKNLLFLIHHMFLPPKLPHKDDSDPKLDGALLDLVEAALGKYRDLVPRDEQDAVSVVSSAMKVLSQGRGPDGKMVEAQLLAGLALLETEPAHIIPLYVVEQNAGVLVTKNADGIRFECFELLPLNHAAMSVTGRLRRSFPGPVLHIETRHWADDGLRLTLAKALAKMSHQPAMGMRPKAKKAGYDHDEDRDSMHPGLVTGLLTAFLQPMSSLADDIVNSIHKHTREEVLWHSARSPWHRSPLWLLVRVVMQLLFTRRGPSGRVAYKSFVAFLLARVLDLALAAGPAISPDIIHCMSAKIAQRLLKLGASEACPAIMQVRAVLGRARDQLERRWAAVIAKGRAPLDLGVLSSLEFEQDVPVALPELDDFIARIASRGSSSQSGGFDPPANLLKHAADCRPSAAAIPSAADYQGHNLAALEDWVALHLDSWLAEHLRDQGTCEALCVLMGEYHAKAYRHYSGNPESLSRMILTVLELWVACDKSAVHHSALLQDYDPKVPLPPLQFLLLPFKSDMARLSAVEDYVEARCLRGKCPSSVLRDYGTSDCFSVRYYDRSPACAALMAQIVADAEKDRQVKIAELEVKKQRYDTLYRKYEATSCSYHPVYSSILGRYTDKHSGGCTKCSYENQMNSINISMHEWPLPSRPLEAKSVVFELMVPPPFSAWREATRFLLLEVLRLRYRDPVDLGAEKTYELKTYDALCSRFSATPTSRRLSCIGLLSRTKPNVATHRNVQPITMASQNSVCVENGLRWKYADPEEQCLVADIEQTDAVLTMCTYVLPAEASVLQPFVRRSFDDSDQTPNGVIASQSECPGHMSLAEYRALAAVPIGHRIQWKNILLLLACPSVDFKKIETLLVVHQTIFQAGPRDGCPLAHRGGHVILHDDRFCHTLLNAVEEAARRIRENWESLHALGSLVSIAARALSLAGGDACRDKALAVLAILRAVGFKWMGLLKDKSYDAAGDVQRVEFLAKAVEIALVCSGTFDVGREHLAAVLGQREAASTFVQCAITVQECSPRNAAYLEGSLQAIMRQRWHGLSYRAYGILRDLFTGPDAGPAPLDDAVRKAWPDYVRATDSRWHVNSAGTDYWLVTKTEQQQGRPGPVVQYNLLTGELFVDGQPLTRLPAEYERHPSYARLFGAFAFQVVPSVVPGMHFSSRQPYKGYSIHFGFESGNLLVRAHRDGDALDFVPGAVFGDSLPDAFVGEYTHWYDHGNGTVRFHRAENPLASPSAASAWKFAKLGGDSHWKLARRNGDCLVNPASKTARRLAKILAPLQPAPLIHVILVSGTKGLAVELPGLQLGFALDKGECAVKSREFRGMCVDAQQDVGTLVGLASKLVLTSADGTDRTVVVPAGNVSSSLPDDHVAVSIAPRPGPAHTYKLDAKLGRLVDDGSLQSKLFLAYLHARTSFCLPDPLTHNTGTEQALTIIGSAAVRSFSVLTHDNLNILHHIAALSPERRYYPSDKQEMQVVTWSGGLGFLAQHGRFRQIVDGLFKQSRDTQIFYPDTFAEPSELGSVNDTLQRRDSSRSSTFRISGFGAEDHLSTAYDADYVSRDGRVSDERVIRSAEVSTLMFHGKTNLQTAPPKKLLEHICFVLGMSPEWVVGTGDESLPVDTLHYDGTFLERHPEHLARIWCRLHGLLNRSTDSALGELKFPLTMWLATMAFAGDADMVVIRILVAMIVIPELRAVRPPDVKGFVLSHGHAADSEWLSETSTAYATDFDDCPEYRIPARDYETEHNYEKRCRWEWESKRDESIGHLVKFLRGQALCNVPPAPKRAAHKPDPHVYVRIENAMEMIRPRFSSWHHNHLFRKYLQNIVDVLGLRPVVPITVPCPVVEINHMKHHQSASSAKGRKRFLSALDLFAPTPAEAACGRAAAPDDIAAAFLRKKGGAGPSLSALEALVDDLEQNPGTRYEARYYQDLRKSLDSLRARPQQELTLSPDEAGLGRTLLRHRQDCERRVQEIYHGIVHGMHEAAEEHGAAFLLPLHHAPRPGPSLFLKQLSRDGWGGLSDGWRRRIVQYGIALAEAQRAERLVRCIGGNRSRNDLVRELSNAGHANWDPLEYPDSLLLEIESGIMIRDVQENIAARMRRPPDGNNAVMQLNMGEGKSSVIVPMVAAALADGTNLVRVVVTKPQSREMFHMLVSKLGGLLNRQVFHMPFSRALRPSAGDAHGIGVMCKRCAEVRGVMLVQPEHILSFKLMGLECMITGRQEVGKSLIATQAFFDAGARDIVDESDENYSVKFELVYTMGQQCPIDFAPERWVVIQAVLGLVRHYAPRVRERMPLDIEVRGRCAGSFPRIRLLRRGAEDALLEQVARHICENSFPGFPIAGQKPDVRDEVYRYITQRELDPAVVCRVEEGPFWTETTRSALLLLRGLFAGNGGGVLGFVLGQKRWRVDYGLDSTRQPETKLSVPYRAKDSPTPRSEFSHPDVVIAATCLSYYYGGLEDSELFLAFNDLVGSDQADAEYQEWLEDAPTLPHSFRQLQGINLKDTAQCRAEVFGHVRYAKGAIDYFLSRIVFPKHVKEFPQRLSASGWDIGAAGPRPVTGFSGTMDSRDVLPLDVHYLDLTEQKHTNALVLEYILRDENTVFHLPSRRVVRDDDGGKGDDRGGEGDDGQAEGGSHGTGTRTDSEILISAVVAMKPPVRVILDVGAQILELTNVQVVQKWLELMEGDDTVKAAVFFDDKEDMQILDRNGRIESFRISPFAEQLDRCLVFLDESHTRGTDLRLPEDYRAAVTLGASLTKDRLVQACMRMRKLGSGQSLVFCVSEEIRTKIRERERERERERGRTPGHGDICVGHVLSWTIGETQANLRRTTPLWAAQGRRFERQSTLWSESRTDDGYQISKKQAEKFLEAESQTLEDRYRPRREETTQRADPEEGGRLKAIADRCREVGSTGHDAATLQEEQERELSPEVEEERQLERPRPAKPRKHELHADVVNFVATGVMPSGSRLFISAFQSLGSTSGATIFDLSQFPDEIFVTYDFAHALKLGEDEDEEHGLDAFQRPVQWIVTGRGKDGCMAVVVISPFEAHHLMPEFEKSGHAATTLHVYAPRPNLEIRPLDGLDLHAIPALPGDWVVPARPVILLNLFSGQAYFGSFREYAALFDMLGLSRQATVGEIEVAADGFIPPAGRASDYCTFQNSPVRFLKQFLTKVRRDCRPMGKTHLGRVLDGMLLRESDFGDDE